MRASNLFTVGAFLIAVAGLASTPASAGEKPQPANGKLKIFILAGQSNMVGFGKVEGGTGTMDHYVNKYPARYGHLVDDNGQPVVRDDVWLVNLTGDKPQTGWLKPGYGASENHIGPEYGFGFVLGDYYEDPVLIIKSAWGGRSLYHNFLPPSSEDYPEPEKDGDKGFQYFQTVHHVKQITSNLKKYYPSYEGNGYEIVGFGWHQGWNDRINADAVDAYEQNMVNFIKDMREDLGVEKLPFVIANTGINGWDIPESKAWKQKVEKHMRAQLRVASHTAHPEFRDNVAGVETRGFWRTPEESPSGQGFHWNRNWETLYLIGESMGEAMVDLRRKAAGDGESAGK
jgi:alpha-galactosidase